MTTKTIIDKVVRYWVLATYDGRHFLAYGNSDPGMPPWKLATLATYLPELVTSPARRGLSGVREMWNKAVKDKMGNARELKVRAIKVEITVKGES